ncbi:hypothetical protein SLS58_009158 [Diplodia intermedia]|uniref:Uncharacterized protein n=1 Tax=Diplodia intermedia TaxID=856260 RepID=A0ABR3TDW1_9PEZI
MISNIALPLLLAGIASAQSQTTSSVISFPFAGDGYYTVIPTAGVSGSIVGVEDARTTLVYECDTFAADLAAFSTVGVLCPFESAYAQTVTYGAGYWGQETTAVASGITAAVDMDCAITAGTPASDGRATATASPVCTMSFGGQYKDELAAFANCAGGIDDVDDIDTQSAIDCLLSPTASATDVAVMTFDPTNVFYWTVTVTAVAEAVATAASASQGSSASGTAASATGSSASASATADAGNAAAAGSGVSRIAVAGVVGLAGVVLAL